MGDRTLAKMERALRGWLVVWLCACGLGCKRERTAPWLVLREVQPTTFEAGTMLRVDGEGFPAGRSCELRLRGQSFGPGRASQEARVSLPCRAVSDDEVQASLDAQSLTALGEHGSFVGSAEVAFASASGDGEVTGALSLRADLGGSLDLASGEEPRLRKRGRHVLELAGIAASDEESTAEGVVVAAVQPNGPAAGLGLAKGDTLERAAEVSVRSLADLAPPPGATNLALVVRRPGQSARLLVSLPLVGFDAPELGAELSRLSILLAWLVLCIAWLSPLPSALPWLVRNVTLYRATRGSAGTLWGRPAPARSRLLRIAAPACASVLGLAVVRFAPPGLLAVRSLSLYLGFAALSLGSSFQAQEGALGERLHTLLRQASRMLVMGIVLGCACALFGARSFDALVEAQGGAPFRWALFQKPALLCAFPLYVVYAGRLSAGGVTKHGRGLGSSVRVLERVVGNVTLCALGAVIFAGGWQAPFDVSGPGGKLLAAGGFVLKVWGFGWLLACARRLGWGDRLSARSVALLCVLTGGLTVAWIGLAPSPSVELLIARALTLSAPIFALVTCVRALPRLWPARRASVPALGLASAPSAAPEGSA